MLSPLSLRCRRPALSFTCGVVCAACVCPIYYLRDKETLKGVRPVNSNSLSSRREKCKFAPSLVSRLCSSTALWLCTYLHKYASNITYISPAFVSKSFIGRMHIQSFISKDSKQVYVIQHNILYSMWLAKFGHYYCHRPAAD